MGDRHAALRPWVGVAALGVVLTLLTAAAGPASGAPYPPLPVAYDREFLSSLTGASLAPGDSGQVSFAVADPDSFGPMSSVVLTFDVYAFNAFPGNATSSVQGASPPVLATPNASGTTVNLSLAPLAPGGHDQGTVSVATSASTPSGTFTVRTALAFLENGTAYRLESRGWFSASTWDAATQLPNGSATLNLSLLGVSGVTAETSIYVASSSWDWALAFILAAALLLVGAGAFLYFRREAKSRAGAR